MTSQLKVDKLEGRTSAGSILVKTASVETDLQEGLAKGWSRHEGGTTTIDSSFNCSSITDTETGIPRHTFTSIFSAEDSYVVMGTAQSRCDDVGTSQYTATFVDMRVTNIDQSNQDRGNVAIIAHGDLA